MRIFLEKIAAAEWEALAPSAHKAVFSETLPPEFDRVDYALLAIDADFDRAVAYMTLRELDRESVYLKHGGAFEPIKGTTVSMPCYIKMLNYIKENYKRATTLVENTNTVYLKMALTAGFIPIGIRVFKSQIFLELLLEEK